VTGAARGRAPVTGAGGFLGTHLVRASAAGRIERPPAHEDTPCRPRLVYERTELAGEQAALAAALEVGVLADAHVHLSAQAARRRSSGFQGLPIFVEPHARDGLGRGAAATRGASKRPGSRRIFLRDQLATQVHKRLVR
jgi:hypothetical protein